MVLWHAIVCAAAMTRQRGPRFGSPAPQSAIPKLHSWVFPRQLGHSYSCWLRALPLPLAVRLRKTHVASRERSRSASLPERGVSRGQPWCAFRRHAISQLSWTNTPERVRKTRTASANSFLRTSSPSALTLDYSMGQTGRACRNMTASDGPVIGHLKACRKACTLCSTITFGAWKTCLGPQRSTLWELLASRPQVLPRTYHLCRSAAVLLKDCGSTLCCNSMVRRFWGKQQPLLCRIAEARAPHVARPSHHREGARVLDCSSSAVALVRSQCRDTAAVAHLPERVHLARDTGRFESLPVQLVHGYLLALERCTSHRGCRCGSHQCYPRTLLCRAKP